MLGNLHSAQHGCMVGNAGLGANLGTLIRDNHAIVQVVSMGVNVRVVRDGAAFVDDDLATIIEQHIFVDGAVVLHRQVVAKGKLDAVEKFDVLTDVFEDMTREHGANAISQPVIQAYSEAVV